MSIIYESKVRTIGENAADFLEEDMMILFSDDAPDELRSYCYIIDQTPLNGEIDVDDILIIDGTGYTITAVGNIVNKNLRDLAHITIKFSGETDSDVAGTLHVEDKEIVQLNVGSTIKIKESNA